jgi:hypothetical protein
MTLVDRGIEFNGLHGSQTDIYCTAKVVLSVEVIIDTTTIYTKSLIFYKIMPFSRNVNHDKMSACHHGREGYTDCNVGQTWSVDYH